MGIDIYMSWPEQSEGERKAQITSFDTTVGNVGYLREAYHGAPYATKHLVKEAFDAERREAPIPAATMRERLADTIALCLIRENRLYRGQDDPSTWLVEDGQSLEQAQETLVGRIRNLFSETQQLVDEQITEASLAVVTGDDRRELMEAATQRKLPPVAMSFYDFVVLAEDKEDQLGTPVTILASY